MNLESLLVKGKQYTIIYFDKKGWPQLKTFYYSGKYPLFIKEGDQFVCWHGKKCVDTSIEVCKRILNEIKGQRKPVTAYYQWPYFSPRYLQRAKMSVFQKPLAEFLKPIEEENLTIYQCIS